LRIPLLLVDEESGAGGRKRINTLCIIVVVNIPALADFISEKTRP
jgi:hypothetical protein